MANYQKIQVSAKFSEVSSFSPSKDWEPDAYNPGSGTYRYEMREVTAAISSGTAIDLGSYTTVNNVIVKNKDTTNYVSATFRTTGGGSNDQVLRIPAGGFVALGSALTIASDVTLTANTAPCACEVLISGT